MDGPEAAAALARAEEVPLPGVIEQGTAGAGDPPASGTVARTVDFLAGERRHRRPSNAAER